MKQNILQTERVCYAIEQMEQISQVLIRKIETNNGMFHVNKLSRGTTGAGWNDALYNAYCFNLIIERIDKMDLDKHSATFLMLAEVVGSTPPQLVHFINLVNYGVVLSLFLTIVGQNPQQRQSCILHYYMVDVYLQLLLLFISFVLQLSCCSQLDPLPGIHTLDCVWCD
jgi:hypothetical protein